MSHDELFRAVILVIPHWFGLTLSFVMLALVLASNWLNWRANKSWTKLAEKCAEAADGYARSDEAVAGGFAQWDRPDLAADARARAVQHREMAQLLRERNRRRGWEGSFLARRRAAEAPEAVPSPRTPEKASEALSGRLSPETAPTDVRR